MDGRELAESAICTEIISWQFSKNVDMSANIFFKKISFSGEEETFMGYRVGSNPWSNPELQPSNPIN